jgi:hypothetical protein
MESKSGLRIEEKIDLVLANKIAIEKSELCDEKHLYYDFGCDPNEIDEICTELESYFNIVIQEGAFNLTVGELKKYVAIKILNPNLIISEADLHFWKRGETLADVLYLEFMRARKLAIIEFIENRYEILENESGNHYKEVINFTILYFVNADIRKKEQIEVVIFQHFPTMGLYLLQTINLLNNDFQFKIDTNHNINLILDEQEGYEEFLNFIFVLFTSIYKEKKVRDNSIKRNFKLMGNGIITYIESELENRIDKQ